jgi:hypothetical protein
MPILKAIVLPIEKERLAHRITSFVERRYGDAREAVPAGGGIQETRPEMMIVRRRTRVHRSPDGQSIIILMTAGAKTRLLAFIEERRARIEAGQGDDDDAEIVALPAEQDFDTASWGAGITLDLPTT